MDTEFFMRELIEDFPELSGRLLKEFIENNGITTKSACDTLKISKYNLNKLYEKEILTAEVFAKIAEKLYQNNNIAYDSSIKVLKTLFNNNIKKKMEKQEKLVQPQFQNRDFEFNSIRDLIKIEHLERENRRDIQLTVDKINAFIVNYDERQQRKLENIRRENVEQIRNEINNLNVKIELLVKNDIKQLRDELAKLLEKETSKEPDKKGVGLGGVQEFLTSLDPTVGQALIGGVVGLGEKLLKVFETNKTEQNGIIQAQTQMMPKLDNQSVTPFYAPKINYSDVEYAPPIFTDEEEGIIKNKYNEYQEEK